MSSVVKDTLLKLRDGRLHLYRQNDSKKWFWRTFLNGKYVVRSTKTDNLAIAKSTAENDYDKHRFQSITPDGTIAHSWEECERGLLNSIAHDDTTRPSRIKNYKVKLGVLRQYFHSFPIHAIKTKTIEDYLAWRRDTYQPPYRNFHSPTVANKTLRSDLLILRQVLKYAKREDFIKSLPDFPKLSVSPGASGWFSEKEWKQLWKFSRKWIKQAKTPQETAQRNYTHDYMMWLVHTGMRVDETLDVRFEDISEIHKSETDREKDCLYVWVRGGKLAYRMKPTEMIGLFGAVRAFERLKARNPEAKPEDLLFPTNPAAYIHELLSAANVLYTNDTPPKRRTAKSFRHTFIMLRLLNGVDVYSLAQNCRTSTQMIHQHYGRYLTSRMKRIELTKFLPRKNSAQRKEDQ